MATNSEKDSTELVYQLDERPAPREAIFAALQHLLAIFVAIVTPALIVSRAISLDLETTSYMVSLSLIVSAIATFIQCRRPMGLGSGLLCVQGTSFSFIAPIISAGLTGGLPLIFGCCLAAAPVEIIVSLLFKHLKRIFTPIVSGVVVTLIGLSLIKVGITACGGGFTAMESGTFGSFQSLGVAASVLVTILLLNKSKNKYIRMSSIFIGIVIGYALALILGMIPMDILRETNWWNFNIPVPFKYGLDFDVSHIIAIAIIYLITSIEAAGDITANTLISGGKIEGKEFDKRIERGVMADGASSMLSAMLNSFPNSIFAQNNGIIQLTGVASRYVGYYIAGMLLLLGLFPGVSIAFSVMPEAVLGGAALLMFGSVAASGIKIIASQPIDRRAALVISAGLSVGLGVELVPEILDQMPAMVKSTFASGITTGSITAIITNIIVNFRK
ncbi:MAG: nucleobase:cation symporter-2 family protein [Bacteroidales bacterium]